MATTMKLSNATRTTSRMRYLKSKQKITPILSSLNEKSKFLHNQNVVVFFIKGGVSVCVSSVSFCPLYSPSFFPLLQLFLIHTIKDIIAGAILGQGSFSTVREVKKIHQEKSLSTVLKCHSDNSDGERFEEGIVEDRSSTVECRYAMKKVRMDLSSTDRSDACDNLRKEATFLARLSHPNIIQIQ